MSKLYVFGIGGTGSRVLKSLTMLLASGVDCGVDAIVPVIIDRDMSNRDLTRTRLLIDNYIAVNNVAAKTDTNRFFRTKIELLNGELCLQLKDNAQKFDDFIGKRAMTRENQAFVEMLFSKETLGMDMTVGFQGNPNVGSVVLNQFEDSELFKAFANDFNKDRGDKIFIISSIFGGTGASGFPLLHKILRTRKTEGGLNNWGQINTAPIGAITVLPYFSVKEATAGSLVDANTFIDKAKAALSYYKVMDKQLDTMYYVADKQVSTYEHNKGGDQQRNNAHFVELAAAMAVLDFVNPNPEKKEENFQRSGNEIKETTYKEFGILPSEQSKTPSVVTFSNLSDDDKRMLINPLSRFFLFIRYLLDEFDNQSSKQPYARHKFDKSFRNNEIMKKLEAVQGGFLDWLKEMENQNRKFIPFIWGSKNAFGFIRNDISVKHKRYWLDLSKSKWATMDNELNKQTLNINKTLGVEESFMELFYRATAQLINYQD